MVPHHATSALSIRTGTTARELGERAPTDRCQFAQRGLAATRGLDQLLGDELATGMVSAVVKLAADLVKHHVQIGLGTLVK